MFVLLHVIKFIIIEKMESPGFQLEIPGFVVLILLVEKDLKIREKRPTTQRYFLKFIKEKLL